MLSIITPVLNGRKYIQHTIESIQKLSIPYEHIIVDGGSIDGTIEYIQQFPHIKLMHQIGENGMYDAIHQGFMESKGVYITWVNSDDYIIASGFKKMYDTIKNNNLDLVYSNGLHHYVDQHRYKSIPALPFARFFLKNGIFPFVQPSSIFSLHSYSKVKGFDYKKFKIIGDRDLFQKMSYDKSIKMKYVPSFSSVFLRYSGSLLYRNLDKVKLEHKYTIKTNNKLPIRLLYHFFRFYKNIIIKI